MIQRHYRDECRCTLCNNVVWTLFFSCVDRYTAATDDGGNAAGEDFRGYVGVREKSKMVRLVA